jgi:hypothetical protein
MRAVAKQTYQLLARLADRGMGETYLARQGEGAGARLVAIERLPRARAADPNAVRSFLESARAGAQLAHPNVAQILDAGRLGSSYFVATDYIDGESLRSVIEHAKAQGRLQVPLRAVLTIAAGAATALHHAHERKSGDGAPGIVHGNLTPTCVIISRDGVVKLLDFGVPAGGALAYRSPEQIRGEAVDARSDLFSLGVVLHELLTREPLFERESDGDTRHAITSEAAGSPSKKRMDVPSELDTIILRLVSKAPAERYRDADDLLVDVEALATKLGFPISTTDLARVMRVWFGAAPNLASLEVSATIETDDLATEVRADAAEVDRAVERVPGIAMALFESADDEAAAEERRAANPTPPPFDVPLESFEEIRDRIMGARSKPDSKAPNPRAHAYTRVPAAGTFPAAGTERTTTLLGISPNAISDVISRVTQAASAAGAQTRETVAAVLAGDKPAGDDEPEMTVTVGGPTTESTVERLPQPPEAEPPARVSSPKVEAPAMSEPTITIAAEPAAPTGINGTPTSEVAKLMAAAEQAEASGPTKSAEGVGDAPRAKSDSKSNAKSDAPRAKSDDKPESVKDKEPSTKIALARTQSTEWFERGEREAKEAQAAAARAVAKGAHAHDHDDHDHAHDHDNHDHPAMRHKPAKAAHRILYPVLGLAAAALVVIALYTIATREPGSKVQHDARAVAMVPADAAEQLVGSAAVGSNMAGSSMAVGSDAIGSNMAGSDLVAASVDAAVVAVAPPVDAAVVVDTAVAVAPPIDAAVVAMAPPVDAAVAVVKPDAAVEHKPKTDHTADHTATADHPKKTPKTIKPAESDDEAPTETIEQMFEKGEFGKADHACSSNTRFNPGRLEVCALAACNVKDTALANRWLRAIERGARDGIIAKCKDLGLELTAP